MTTFFEMLCLVRKHLLGRSSVWFALIEGWCSAGVRFGGFSFEKKRCGLVRGDMGIEENLRCFRFSKRPCICQGNLESMQKSGFRFSDYPIFFLKLA